MKKTLFSLTLILLLSGCSATLKDIRVMNRINTSKLRLGMERDKAISVMGQGLYMADNTMISNPYRSQTVKVGDKVYEVVFYYTDINKYDDIITDDELTPLVFDGRQLIGWGWPFMDELTKG